MSHHYYDRGGPQEYDYAPSAPRRPPPPRDPYGPDPRRPRGPPQQMRPHPGAGAPRGGYPVRPPPPQQYSRPPPPMEQDEGLYDGSAYGGAEYEQNDSWPLPAPAPAFAQQPRERSPGSPSGSGSGQGGSRGQRQPPRRPQRPDYQEPIYDQPRSAGRPPPDPRAYQRGPPPPRSHHGDGQWNGEGYNPPPQNFPPQSFQRPPRERDPQPQHIPDFPTPHQQQASYRQQPNPRPPLGPPPSARRGPASYYPQIAPVHPIVEETDSYRGSIRNASTVAASHSSYASSNAIPIGIPDYYLEERNSMLPQQQQQQQEPERESVYDDESPIDPSIDGGRDSRNTERTGPSPDPAAFVRQASLGKKSKPTLTTVKSGERARREGMPAGIGSLPSQQDRQQRAPATEKELWPPRVGPPRPSYEDDDDYRHDSYGGAGMDEKDENMLRKPSVKRRSSDILSSGTGLIDPSETSDDSEKGLERQTQLSQPRPREADRSLNRVPSKELLSVSAALSKEQQHRPRSRSPLAPDVDPRVERIVGGLEKGGALTAAEADQLKHEQAASLPSTAGNLSDKQDRRPRPPKLELDRVRDAEARGSLTSLPDLIRRATKVASNLDRGKTASRLGMGFFENSSQTDVERMRALDRANRRSGASGLSDMLASFPPPRGRDGEAGRRWSAGGNQRHEVLPSTSDAGGEGGRKGKGRRRCCGMPVWLFVLLVVVLLLLVAAAIVVPVVLVVLPKEDEGGSLAKRCERSLGCANGGVAVADVVGVAGRSESSRSSEEAEREGGDTDDLDGRCRCVCVGGYTGRACGTFAPAACTMTAVGETLDATVGSGIPGVLAEAAGFGLQLDGQRLLGLFSREDLTCLAQNALVTFSGGGGGAASNQRRHLRCPTPTMPWRRQDGDDGDDDRRTSNGLIVAPPTTFSTTSAGAAAPAPSTTAATAASNSSTADTSGSADNNNSTDATAFAAAAVLYLFQTTSSLEQAGTAQTNLQAFFSGRSSSDNGSEVDLGGGWVADLTGLSVRDAGGDTVGS